MQNINFRRVFVISALLALVLIYAVLWMQMIRDPVERTGTDFMAFYAAGKIARENGMSQVYNLQLQKQVEERVLGFSIFPTDVFPFLHPPFILPVLSILSYWNYPTAFYAWGVFLLSIFILSSWILSRLVDPTEKSSVLFFGCLLFFPAFVSILNGQDTAILVLGGAVWLHGFTNNDDRNSGLGLALTTIRPHIAILLAIPFLFKRRKIFWWFCVGAGFLTLFSIALVKISGTISFIEILTISASGEDYKTNENAMFNLIGFLHRVGPTLKPDRIRLIGWIIYLISFIALIFIWVRSETVDERHIGIAVLISVVAAPHLHYHDLTFILISVFCLLLYMKRYLKWNLTNIFPLGISIILLFGHIQLFRFITPYLIIISLALAIWFSGRIQNDRI